MLRTERIKPAFTSAADLIRRRKRGILAALSGILLSLSFPGADLKWLAWIAFVPWFESIAGVGPRKAFALSLLAGVFFWVFTIYWLVHVTFAGTALLIAYLALYHGCAGVLISLFLPSPSGKVSGSVRRISFWGMAAIPCVWVAVEYCRSFFLTGFPWALAGYSQYLNPPVIQISDITGVWGVSFAVVMANVCVYLFCRSWNEGRYRTKKRHSRSRRRRRSKILAPGYLFCSAVILACVFAYGYYKLSVYAGGTESRPSDGSLKVAVIQGNIPQAVKWDPSSRDFILRKYFSMSVAALAGNPDVIVWPEASLPTALVLGDPGYEQVFKRWYDDHSVPVMLGAVTAKGDAYYNSVVLTGAGEWRQYDKIHLVPFGEYIPLRPVFRFLESFAPIGDVSAGSEYTLFDIAGRDTIAPVRVAALICFEDVFPGLAREFTLHGAQMFFTVTNDAWYMRTSAAKQHAQASVFRAVENRRAVARAANTGYSCFIEPTGAISGFVADDSGEPLFVDGILQSGVTPRNEITLYTRWGDWFARFCCGAAVLTLFTGVLTYFRR